MVKPILIILATGIILSTAGCSTAGEPRPIQVKNAVVDLQKAKLDAEIELKAAAESLKKTDEYKEYLKAQKAVLATPEGKEIARLNRWIKAINERIKSN